MKKRILTIDDEQNIVRVIQVNLEKEGYEVLTGSNGQEAVDIARAESPDLIIMDIQMPEMDGITALRILKDDEKTSRIPVVMLTAKAEDEDVFHGWQSGADLYLTKPFNLSELLTFVSHILASNERAENEDQVYEITVSDDES